MRYRQSHRLCSLPGSFTPMTIFSKLSTKSTRTRDGLSATGAKTKAKVCLGFPRSESVLSGIKVAAVVAGRLGSSVPYMQGIVEAANEIVACAEVSILS